MTKRRIVAYAFGIIFTLAILIYLVLNLEWVLLRSLLANLEWKWLSLAFLTYFLNILLRALRFKSLIYSRSIHWQQLVPISALHNLFMYLLPAKTGDISFIVLVKNRLGIPLTKGTATLLAVRFYDFSVIVFLLLGLLPFLNNEAPGWIYQTALVFIFLGLLGILGVLLFFMFSPRNIAEERFSNPFLLRMVAIWNKLIAGLVEIKNSRSTLRVALLTTGVWLCIYTNSYLIAQSLGTEISYIHICIISLVMVPLTLLPIQGFANAGTHEIGWLSVLIAFDYSYDTALAIAVGSHFLLLISIIISASISYLFFNNTLPDLNAKIQEIDK